MSIVSNAYKLLLSQGVKDENLEAVLFTHVSHPIARYSVPSAHVDVVHRFGNATRPTKVLKTSFLTQGQRSGLRLSLLDVRVSKQSFIGLQRTLPALETPLELLPKLRSSQLTRLLALS